MQTDTLDLIRRFNRTVTQRIGALSDNYLDSGRPLGEARLLFEIGPQGATVRDLRTRLCLDSGYISRMLRELEAQKLTTAKPDPSDRRLRKVTLTAKGKKAWSSLEVKSFNLASSLLEPLSEAQQERLLTAMDDVVRLLRASAVTVAVADPFCGQAQACIHAYFQELRQRFDEGFDPANTVSAHPEELVPPAGYFLMAQLEGEAVGCAALKIKQGGIGEIKRMWVAPSARGLGIAQRLLKALEAQAIEAGIDVLQLDSACESAVCAVTPCGLNGCVVVLITNDKRSVFIAKVMKTRLKTLNMSANSFVEALTQTSQSSLLA